MIPLPQPSEEHTSLKSLALPLKAVCCSRLSAFCAVAEARAAYARYPGVFRDAHSLY